MTNWPHTATKSIPAVLLTLVLAGCSEPAAPPEPEEASPSPAETTQAAPAPAQEKVSIAAPAGTYSIDPYHSHISFSVNHLGLSNYIARFTDYEATIELDPENPENSSVTATIDPASIRTDHDGDYKATHQDSPYDTWDEDLAQSPKFFNAGEHPQITYRSTQVEVVGPDLLRVTGDLTLLGQTHPVVLNTRIVGDSAAHPMSGKGAIGFSATGQIQRSEYGMTHLLDPELIGNAVTIRFEGEFHQVVPQAEVADTTEPEEEQATP